MPSARAGARGILRIVALVLSGVCLVASAQELSGTAPQRDSTKITVTRRLYDKTQLLSAPALTESAYRGRALWLQRCAYCHDGVGQPSYNTMGPWMGAETVQLLGEVALRAIIAAGTERMPGFQYSLQPQQVNELIAFLKTVPAAAKPTPAQSAGKAPEGTVSGD